jgi:hypothetical protein
MRAILLAALLSLAAAPAALAGTYSVTIRDPLDWRTGLILKSIKVEGGTVGEMPRAVAGQPFVVDVTLPEDNCFTRVSLFFGPGLRSDVMGNVCANLEIVFD